MVFLFEATLLGVNDNKKKIKEVFKNKNGRVFAIFKGKENKLKQINIYI